MELATSDSAQHVYLAYNSTSYPNIDYYSGSGCALVVPSTAGATTSDKYRYGAGNLLSSSYYALIIA